jgi:predicted ribosome quality control (RQC) complex YloA/Tae2 family protein
MDPLVLSRLVPAWREELVGASFAGLRPRADGVELVFDRAPEGTRPGRRTVLCVRFAPPLWAWTEPAPPGGADWTFRMPAGAVLQSLEVPALDRRLALDFVDGTGRPYRIHLELWPPGNVLVEETGVRLVWCARTRPASSFRPALEPDLPYAPPGAPVARDAATCPPQEFAEWLRAAPAEAGARLGRLARDFAGLPRGLLEALAPTLPRALLAEHLPNSAEVLAGEFAAWSRGTYDVTPPVRAYVWTFPSAGATLVTRALEPGGTIRFVGSYGSWSEAARELSRALPAPVDASRVTAARAAIKRLERAEVSLRTEIEEAGRAAQVRAEATALAAFLPRVPKGAARVALPDPAEPSRCLDIALDPKLKPHENVDRLFKRAGKLERVAEQAPARLAEVQTQLERARRTLEAVERGETVPAAPARGRAPRPDSATSPPLEDEKPSRDRTPTALLPRRYRTTEGWEVLIGKSNLGNDHLTHRLARPEDYWMHVHGAAGSHVVLRRGKGPNEPSKATIEEVAGWAAFYSQAKNAGTVPVTVTQKKYVSKPRKSPAGLAHVLRSKTVFARPTEPPDERRVAHDDDSP